MSAADTVATIARLSAWLEGTSITSLALVGAHGHLLLERDAAGQTVMQAAQPADVCGLADTLSVRAPTPGQYLDRHPLDTAPLVAVGQCVVAGQVLALLRVGPLLQAVHAPCSALVQALPVPPGQRMGYGDTLLQLRPIDLPATLGGD